MARLFFRLVANDHPSEADFSSNYAKGNLPRGLEVEDLEIHRGISAYTDLTEAIRLGGLSPRLGGFVATLELDDDDSVIRVRRTSHNPASSHHTLWGEPVAFLQRLSSVVAIDAAITDPN